MGGGGGESQCDHVEMPSSYLLSYLSHSLGDRWGTTADFTTSFLHFLRFSAFHSSIFHSRPVHSLMLSSHCFLCLPLRLPPWKCQQMPNANRTSRFNGNAALLPLISVSVLCISTVSKVVPLTLFVTEIRHQCHPQRWQKCVKCDVESKRVHALSIQATTNCELTLIFSSIPLPTSLPRPL